MERPSHHANDSATSFRNPWNQSKSLLSSGQVFATFPIQLARALQGNWDNDPQVVTPDFAKNVSEEGVLKATWLGHAGFLVQLPATSTGPTNPVRIIFDPIWSERASPSQLAGPRRRLPPPCALEDLPEFQFVVISHNHYDHLDWPTVERMYMLRGARIHFLVPLGNKAWFCAGGIPASQVTELDWWQEIELVPSNDASVRVRFACTPAQHSSGRSLFDQRATLWASWVVQQSFQDHSVSVYHAGDTGYMTHAGPCPAFKEISEKYGPFDLAMLPIWRGASLSFVASLGLRFAATDLLDGHHASPAHALALHRAIRARHSIGMHFATFAGSAAEAREALAELHAARDMSSSSVLTDVTEDVVGETADSTIGDWYEEGGFGTIDVGATIVLPAGQTGQGSPKIVSEIVEPLTT